MPDTLHLNLRREYFAQIAAKTKHVEYRKRTPYWRKRLEGRKYDVIKFRNGYATRAPEMIVQFRALKSVAGTTKFCWDASQKSNAGNHRNQRRVSLPVREDT